MTASKIAALTACAWPGCASPIHRRDLCPKHGHRVSVLEAEGVSRDLPETWEPAWCTHTIALRARRAEHGRGVLAATRARSVEEPQPAVQSTLAVEQDSEPDRSGWPVLVPHRLASDAWQWPEDAGINGRSAVWFFPPSAWFSCMRGAPSGTLYGSAIEAADAIHARLPDEVSEAARTVAPQPPPPLGGITFAQAVEIAEADGRARRAAPLNVRPEVAAFAMEMERKLAVNDAKKGQRGWKGDEPFDLLDRVREEADEVYGAIVRDNHADILAECADVANMAMMVADAAGALTVPAAVVAPQPPPTNTTGDVWQELIDAEPPGRIRDLMVARREQGIAKYGRPLGRENGRDHAADAIQEALDGMVYAVAAGRPMAALAFRDALSHLLNDKVDGAAWIRWDEVSAKLAAGDAEKKAMEHRLQAEIADLRSQVEAFRRAACVATGWGENTTPGDATLIETLRGGQWVRRSEAQSWVKELEEELAALVKRAEAAEAKHSELVGAHLAFSLAVQGRAIREGAPEHECKAWYAGRDAIRQHVEAKERRAAEAEADLAEVRRWAQAGPGGCAPYRANVAGMLIRLDESFKALGAIESSLRTQIAEAKKAQVDPANDLRWAVVRATVEQLASEIEGIGEEVSTGVVWMALAGLRAVVPGVSNG